MPRIRAKPSIAATLALLANVCAGAIPLPERPRPDWCRSEWINLNGEWRFEFDAKNAGVREKWFSAADSRFGSYGYLVEAEIPAEVVAKGGGTVMVRLEAEKGGLAIYGSRFGRYPLDPSVWPNGLESKEKQE